MTPENARLLERLAVALAIGLLMGLERGWEFRQLPEGGRVAGIRTFGLIALLGAIVVQIAGPYRELMLAAAMLAIAMLMGIGYWRATRGSSDVSITTPIAALVALGLGAMAGLGQITIASSAAVVVTLILDFRIEL
ncbi:MAG TPA: MgtC/SapB family protein, partial [Candidatus Binataceae bacterium]|nr:MgtC/SapB family protein [Candidatus Binataceae bacterium]